MEELTSSLLGWESAPSLPGSQQACQTLGAAGASPSVILLLALHLPSWQQLTCGDLFLREQLMTMADAGSPLLQFCSCLCVQLDFLKELIFRISH